MERDRIRRREVRGDVLRREYDDLKRRIDAADDQAKSACFNHIRSTFRPVSDGYALASSADRERILKEVRIVSRKLWEAGNRPQALALGIIMLNIESQFAPGENAVFVKSATDALIREAGA
jgi:hypothetical protein